MSKKITIYIVEQATWGADYPVSWCFESKKAAEEFYNTNDYTSKPYSKRISAARLGDLKDMGILH